MNSELTPEQQAARREFMLGHETALWSKGISPVAGIDEAGRGPLAGPVVAAAVVFEPDVYIEGVNDSKQLTPEEREEFYHLITARATSFGIGIIDHSLIDEINILNATFRAMHTAISKLSVSPAHLLVDGNRFPEVGIPFTAIVEGDARSFSIAAASIIAKVTRDRIMLEYDRLFPGYGFATNKGYGTREHREALLRLGPCEIHRRSFEVRNQLELEL